jgi:hypothetical protein
MEAILDHISLAESERALKIPTRVLTGELCTDVEELYSSTVDFVIDIDKNKVAPYTTRNGQPTSVFTKDSKVFVKKPPIIYVEDEITDEDLDKRSADRPNPYEDSGQEAFINGKIDALGRTVDRAVEVQAGNILQTGIAELKNASNVVLDTIDYGRDAALTYTIGTKWDNSSSKPVTDLETLIQKIFDKSGGTVDFVAMGYLAWAAALENEKFQKVCDKNFGNYGQADRQVRYDGGMLGGRIGSIDIWVIQDTRIMDSKKVAAACRQYINGVIYAGVTSEETGQRNATSRQLDMILANRPVRTLLSVKSAPVVKFPIIDSTGCIQVLT